MTKLPVADTKPVIDAYIHALTASYPHARYLVGNWIWLALIIQSLPEWISDRILALHNGDLPIPEVGMAR